MAAEPGLVVEDVETGWCGAVVRVEKVGGMQVVHLEDRAGRRKGFPLGPGFLLDGAPVILTAPTAATRAAVQEAKAVASRTASGSRAVEGMRARVAAGSRTFVAGTHDAALGEQILNVTEAEVETKVQPHGVSDDLGREVVTAIG